jgi:hypothetical protein
MICNTSTVSGDTSETGTTSDHWIDEFYYRLEAQGLTKPPAK